LIGGFADQCLTEFTPVELRQFERLLDEDDKLIDDWIFARQSLPQGHDNTVIAWLHRFCREYSPHTCANQGAGAPRDQHHDGAADPRLVASTADRHYGVLAPEKHPGGWREWPKSE
jgi:Flavinator of succinate dehydrogenase